MFPGQRTPRFGVIQKPKVAKNKQKITYQSIAFLFLILRQNNVGFCFLILRQNNASLVLVFTAGHGKAWGYPETQGGKQT